MVRVLVALTALLAAPSIAFAQTAISGTSRCGKPQPQHLVQAVDQTNHTFALMKVKCSWPEPLEIGGLQTKTDDLIIVEELAGSSGTDRTFSVGLMSNGDKIFVRAEGKVTLRNGVVQSTEGTWTYTGGTGTMRGLTGKGTFKGDGTTTTVEGVYELPR